MCTIYFLHYCLLIDICAKCLKCIQALFTPLFLESFYTRATFVGLLNKTRGLIQVYKIKKTKFAVICHPFFNGENINLWSIKMLTYLENIDISLSKVIENGILDLMDNNGKFLSRSTWNESQRYIFHQKWKSQTYISVFFQKMSLEFETWILQKEIWEELVNAHEDTIKELKH